MKLTIVGIVLQVVQVLLLIAISGELRVAQIQLGEQVVLERRQAKALQKIELTVRSQQRVQLNQ